MKILHTADLHFHESTLDDLKAPTRAIVEYAREHKPRHVVIAGDLTTERGVIDNATAVAVRTFVRQLRQHTPNVWVLAGNHDLTFREGQPNNLRAILSSDTGSVMDGVVVIDGPYIHPPFAFLPYPSVPGYHARTGLSDLGDINDKLEDLSYDLHRQLSTEYGDYWGTGKRWPQLLVWHGTVEGGRTGEESSPALRTRNNDVILGKKWLGHYDAVLCGHLHQPQTILHGKTAIVYPGSIAPLTFGERNITPGVELWDFDVEAETSSRRRLPLPVVHQRLQTDVEAADWDESRDAKLNLWQWVNELDAPPRARVKVKAVLPKGRFSLLNDDVIESVREDFSLHELRVEKIEEATERIRLGEGQDRAARVDLVESLTTYGETIGDPKYNEHLEDIREVAREIEDGMSSDHADPRYGFEPIALRAENYKQFGSVAVDFQSLPGRAGVLGSTGIGKSNLILAVAAALYGGNPKSEGGKAKASLASMVRRGETSGMIQLEFAGEFGRYRITRSFKLDGKGRAQSALFFEQGLHRGHGEYDWVSINEGTSRETQAAIERVVGPEALHWLTRHLRQHGVSAVKMTAGDLADAINSTLQLDFEARVERAKDMHSDAVRSRDKAVARLESRSEHIVPLDKIEAQEAHSRGLRAKAGEAGQKASATLERMEADRVEITERRARTLDVVKQLDDRRQRRIKLQAEIGRVNEEVAKLREEQFAAGDPPDVPALEAAAAAARDRLDEAQARLSAAKDDCHVRDLEEAKRLGAVEQSRAACAAARQDAYRKHEAAKRELEQAARYKTLLDRVPCRGLVWRDADKSKMDGGTCELLTDAKATAERIKELADAEQRAGELSRAADEDHDAAHKQQQALMKMAEEQRAMREKRVLAAKADTGVAADELRASEGALSDARQREARANAIAQRLAPTRARLETLQEQLDEIPVNEGHFTEQRQKLDTLDGILARTNDTVKQLREQVAQSREQIARADADLEQLALERVQRDDMLKANEADKREAEESERRRMALDYYRRAVERNGIPAMLMEQLAPQLERRVNDILSPVGRALRIETERQLVSGKSRTEITLSFRSPSSGNDFVPIAELSGGEEDLCNLALAAGLARVSAEMSGTQLGTVILDEPCAGVSESLQAETLEVLARISEHVRRSIIVTHRRDLASACDVILDVRANGDGSSHVEVIG